MHGILKGSSEEARVEEADRYIDSPVGIEGITATLNGLRTPKRRTMMSPEVG